MQGELFEGPEIAASPPTDIASPTLPVRTALLMLSTSFRLWNQVVDQEFQIDPRDRLINNHGEAETCGSSLAIAMILSISVFLCCAAQLDGSITVARSLALLYKACNLTPFSTFSDGYYWVPSQRFQGVERDSDTLKVVAEEVDPMQARYTHAKKYKYTHNGLVMPPPGYTKNGLCFKDDFGQPMINAEAIKNSKDPLALAIDVTKEGAQLVVKMPLLKRLPEDPELRQRLFHFILALNTTSVMRNTEAQVSSGCLAIPELSRFAIYCSRDLQIIINPTSAPPIGQLYIQVIVASGTYLQCRGGDVAFWCVGLFFSAMTDCIATIMGE